METAVQETQPIVKRKPGRPKGSGIKGKPGPKPKLKVYKGSSAPVKAATDVVCSINLNGLVMSIEDAKFVYQCLHKLFGK